MHANENVHDPSPRHRVLRRLQRALESLYRVDAEQDVSDFVIGSDERQALGVARAPHEQLLLRQDPAAEALEVALFVDEATLARLAGGGAGEERLADLMLAVEGVSHFVYVMVRARAERPFSALELELQAEVDKYLLVLLGTWPRHALEPAELRRRLFRRVRFHDDLTDEERDRYATANAAAEEYAASLEHRFLRRRFAVDDLLRDARRFYRLACADKLGHIAREAA